MYSKDLATNTSTGLMAIRDLATYNDIPINIHFNDHYIHIVVGFGTPEQKKTSWYVQDMYNAFERTDKIYNWIENAIDDIKNGKTQRNSLGEAYRLICDILDGKKDDTYLEEVRGYLGQALDA